MSTRIRGILVRVALWVAALNIVAGLIRGELLGALLAGGVTLISAGLLAGFMVKLWRLGPLGEAGDYIAWLLSWVVGVLFLVAGIAAIIGLLGGLQFERRNPIGKSKTPPLRVPCVGTTGRSGACECGNALRRHAYHTDHCRIFSTVVLAIKKGGARWTRS